MKRLGVAIETWGGLEEEGDESEESRLGDLGANYRSSANRGEDEAWQ